MRGQRAIEYMLFVGAAILIALLVVFVVSGRITQANAQVNSSALVLKNYSTSPNGSSASPAVTATIQASQPTSTVSGFARDSSSQPINGVVIKVIQGADSIGSAYSDYSGFYSFKLTAGGNYVLNASKNGFATAQAPLTASIGNDYAQDFELSRV